MQKVKIITDSASDLPNEYFEKYNISMLPMGIVIDDKTYLDRVELGADEFFEIMRNNPKSLPTTVMPSVETIEAEFTKNLDTYENQIYVSISSKGSGAYGIAKIVKEQIEERLGKPSNITIIDSLSYSVGYAIVVKEMARLAYEGADYKTVMNYYENRRKKIDVLMVVDDLMHLKRGGRIKPTVAYVGEMLGIKPLLTIKDGLIDSFGKARGKRRAMEKMAEILISKAGKPEETEIWIVHTNAQDDAEEFKKIVEEGITPKEITISQLGACIGVHMGEGLIGVIYDTA
ncbi:MAG: DegV domain-containing protein [Firmicutes bacterium ADurb.Bin193]|nr:MAG: DegV domain-containing protein [Firmicutes bacterium ADurb.Bin193]